MRDGPGSLYLAAALAVCCLLGATATAVAQPATPTAQQMLTEMRTDVQGRADRGLYPIEGIDPQDVREVLARIGSMDRDEWAAAWSAQSDRQLARGRALEATDRDAARDAYLEAWRLAMFGGWPARTTPGKEAAYQKCLVAFREYGRLLNPPMEVVRIPFEGSEIVGYLRLPPGGNPVPVIIGMGGLDSFKEFAEVTLAEPLLTRGMGILAMDMPGVGESPVKMEIGAERVFTRVIDALSARPDVDPARIGVYGISAGGYWSTLLGYTERTRLRAVASLGAPVDHYFDADWQRGSWGTREYLFGLKEARMHLYNTTDEATFLAKLPAFSLKARGILSQPSTAMLIGNGARDTQVPIADTYAVLNSGTAKFVWVDPAAGHTGMAPGITPRLVAETVVAPWLASQMAGSSPSHR